MPVFLQFLAFLFLVVVHVESEAETFRRTLISAEKNMRTETWQVTHQELTPRAESGWSVRKITLHGGKQEGVDLVILDNGILSITVVPTRGMGILEVKGGKLRIGWESPVKEVVHPAFINLQSRGGLGWLEGFNEWLVRCGLENTGHPGTDEFINNVGEKAQMDLTLHGKIANIPASEVEVVVDREPPHRIAVRGRVDERMFYGPQLELWTEVSAIPGEYGFRVSDTLTNRGDSDSEFQLLYHVNFGAPLLEEGARFIAPIQSVAPFNAHAAEAIQTFQDYSAPTPGFVEQVYCMHLYSATDSRTTVGLVTQNRGRAVSMSFSTEELPCMTLWKNTGAIKDGYVTGLEPGTSFPYNRRIERGFGRVPKIAPGGSREFHIDFEVHSGHEKVEELGRRIEAIRAGRPTEVSVEPPKID
ncbi:MAG: hypothetical protein GHCLOJNM_02812 [bacterium]|nr:hypothetical protein [bacterium]